MAVQKDHAKRQTHNRLEWYRQPLPYRFTDWAAI
ncbi:hypothetical protein PEL8287_01955 [Roseovarius litorisediminis]|uniref:Uncharacterized protein n=1 Tax=Roseovarius litorisediminis TaxID=1312363 RepID=A0A1Y5SKG6_9RHOB|nr:hypothetical protein PEL8287_01955 [Roseovarius litorisediminis]